MPFKKYFLVIAILYLLFAPALSQETIILNNETIKNYYPKIGLALGGGSARGFFHIGVLKVLEREGIPLAMISGTSMGSFIGGLTAQGLSAAEITSIIEKLNFNDFFSTNPITKKTFQSKYVPWLVLFQKEPVGMFNSSYTEEFLRKYSLAADFQADFNFDKYPIPLRVVATDFISGQEKIFSEGPFYQTVAASTAVPFVFKPYYKDGRYYFDGGISELVPVSPLKAAGVDYIIAVNVLELDTDDRSLYNLAAYASHFNDMLVTQLGEKTFKLANCKINFPADPELSANDYQELKKFIAAGEASALQELPKIQEYLEKLDNNSEPVFLTKVTNATSANIPEFKNGWYPKNKIIRTIYKYTAPRETVLEFANTLDGATNLNIYYSRQNLLQQILVKGNKIPLDPETKQKIKSLEGQNYEPALRREIQNIIAEFYRNKGIYLFTQNYDYNNNILVIHLAEARINEIKIVGNKFIPTSIINKLIKLNIPSIYNNFKIEHIIKALYATDLFYSVKPTIKKHESGHDLTLILEIKEKDKGLFFLSGQYFSAEKEPEFELGYHDFYTFGQIKPFAFVRSGKNFGASAGIEWYEVANTNLGLGIYYDKTHHNIDIYDWNTHRRDSGFSFNEESTDILFNYTTYDYVLISVGQRFKNYSLAENNLDPFYPRSVKVYRPLLVQLQYDNTDQQLLPNSGMKASCRWEENGYIDRSYLPKKDLFFWYALPLAEGALWWKYKEAETKGSAPLFLGQAPRRDILPFGFRDTEAFSSHFVYQKFSYVNKFLFGSSYEIALDHTRFINANSWANSTGLGISVHYPSYLGLCSAGIGLNNFNKVFYLNLSKGI